jgi:hypothetical protein
MSLLPPHSLWLSCDMYHVFMVNAFYDTSTCDFANWLLQGTLWRYWICLLDGLKIQTRMPSNFISHESMITCGLLKMAWRCRWLLLVLWLISFYLVNSLLGSYCTSKPVNIIFFYYLLMRLKNCFGIFNTGTYCLWQRHLSWYLDLVF